MERLFNGTTFILWPSEPDNWLVVIGFSRADKARVFGVEKYRASQRGRAVPCSMEYADYLLTVTHRDVLLVAFVFGIRSRTALLFTRKGTLDAR